MEKMLRLTEEAAQSQNAAFLKITKEQYSLLETQLLAIAPEMTHVRLGLQADRERFAKIEEEAKRMFPGDFEAQMNYSLAQGG